MTRAIDAVAGWEDINEALVSARDFITEFRDEQQNSGDSASPYQQAHRALSRLSQLTLDLAAMRLQEIDDDIAASGLVEEINGLAKEAKDEANALKEAADKLKGIADIIGKVAGIVTKVAALF